MTDRFFEARTSAVGSGSFHASQLDQTTDNELDQLPFGVIALDAEGTVLRYNQYESRLARLDRNQVLGRGFFREVAPCTRAPDFEGRFQRYVAEGSHAPERFKYLFDFKFGAQEVDVELVRPSELERYYLLINRTDFRAARADGIPAPLQAELAPDEHEQGVRRDAADRRIVEFSSGFFAGLKATCDRLAPQTWPLFCDDWGVEWGRRAAIDLEASHLEADGKSLRELSMRRVAEILQQWFREQGLGRLSLDFAYAHNGCLLVTLERSALAEAVSRPLRPAAAGPPTCALLAGCVSALVSHVGNRRLAAREFRCAASGAPSCGFLLVGQSRKAALDELIESGEADLPRLVRALTGTPGRAH